MSIYTFRLAAMLVETAGWVSLYEAPNEGRVVIRDVTLAHELSTPIDPVRILMRPLTRTGDCYLFTGTVAGKAAFHLDMRQVLAPRELLLFYTAAAPISVAVTGYHLGV